MGHTGLREDSRQVCAHLKLVEDGELIAVASRNQETADEFCKQSPAEFPAQQL